MELADHCSLLKELYITECKEVRKREIIQIKEKISENNTVYI